jgi:protein TonB
VDQGPQIVASAPPEYPYAARSRNQSGTVTVRFLVAEDGSVTEARVLAADPPGVFDASVLRAVRSWRFTPGRLGGRAVSTWVELPVRFDLGG